MNINAVITKAKTGWKVKYYDNDGYPIYCMGDFISDLCENPIGQAINLARHYECRSICVVY